MKNTYTRNTKIEVLPGYHEWRVYKNDEQVTALQLDIVDYYSDEEIITNEMIQAYVEDITDYLNEQLEEENKELFSKKELELFYKSMLDEFIYHYGDLDKAYNFVCRYSPMAA